MKRKLLVLVVVFIGTMLVGCGPKESEAYQQLVAEATQMALANPTPVMITDPEILATMVITTCEIIGDDFQKLEITNGNEYTDHDKTLLYTICLNELNGYIHANGHWPKPDENNIADAYIIAQEIEAEAKVQGVGYVYAAGGQQMTDLIVRWIGLARSQLTINK